MKKILFATSLMLCLLAKSQPKDVFLYGASVYPELQTKDEQIRMLDLFQKAHYTMLRLGESAWGNIEKEPGKYDFAWLHFFLDEMQKRNMKAILGTCSYIPPQWLPAQHPEVLVEFADGEKAHSMSRRSVCKNHPVYRKYLADFLHAYAREFRDHPAVIGWQIDNERDADLIEHTRVCHNVACKQAWADWLKQTYTTVDELNARMCLKSWGMQVTSFSDVMLPCSVIDGNTPAVHLAYQHFQRDNILEFFKEQVKILKEEQVKGFITTDWMPFFINIADDPKQKGILDITGLNCYQPSEDVPAYWDGLLTIQDQQRSSMGNGKYIVTETRIGVAGGEEIWGNTYMPDEFKMWMIEPAMYGAVGLMHWSGNRWNGGHWPHWGGVLDWSGNPEPDYELSKEVGEFYAKWGKTIVSTGVEVKAAVINDFDQRSALNIYKHSPKRPGDSLIYQSFDAFHRLGIGVDGLPVTYTENPEILKKYKTIVMAAAVVFDNPKAVAALKQYVEQGGNLIITSFTAYQNWDGVFRNDGLASNLKDLSGGFARTTRVLAYTPNQVAADRMVKWNGAFTNLLSPVASDQFYEMLEITGKPEIVALFDTKDPYVNGKPAAIQNTLGKGKVLKLAYRPQKEELISIIRQFSKLGDSRISLPLPNDVRSVPRTDGSIFIFNTSSSVNEITLLKSCKDRISGKNFSGKITMSPYQMLWLE